MLVVREGRIAHRGSYQELMARGVDFHQFEVESADESADEAESEPEAAAAGGEFGGRVCTWVPGCICFCCCCHMALRLDAE